MIIVLLHMALISHVLGLQIQTYFLSLLLSTNAPLTATSCRVSFTGQVRYESAEKRSLDCYKLPPDTVS